MISTVRYILSSAVAVSLPNTIVRWILLFEASLIIFIYSDVPESYKVKINNISIALRFFVVVAVIGSLINGSFPVVSMAKILAFYIVFLATLKGVAANRNIEWDKFAFFLFLYIVIASAVVLPFGRFKIRNGTFQGVVNQPNMFGILCPLFAAAVYNYKKLNERILLRTALLILTAFLCFASKSRTGMYSYIATVGFHTAFFEESKQKKITITIVLVFSLLFVIITDLGVVSILSDFMYKGNDDSIFASRIGQIENTQFRYQSHKILGSGFMTPYYPDIRSFIFSFDLVVEPGNIFYNVLGDTGIVGLGFFVFFMIRLFKNGSAKYIYLLVTVIMINMGEMIFFSTNNIAVFVYFFIALYLFNDDNAVEL